MLTAINSVGVFHVRVMVSAVLVVYVIPNGFVVFYVFHIIKKEFVVRH